MANPYMPMVNQRLSYVRIQLGAASESLRRATVNRGFEQGAFLQGALAQLVDAYWFYLREMAFNYTQSGFVHSGFIHSLGQRDAPVFGVAPSVKQLCRTDQAPAEVKELLELEADPDSWLASLLSAYAARLYMPAGEKPEQEKNRDSIAAVDLTTATGPMPLTVDVLSHWMQSMQNLVDRHRETMIEC